MTVKELIKHLRTMPQDLEVVYSIDAEGNGYEKVFYHPSLGYFSPPDFESVETLKHNKDNKKPNAVCIN